MNMELWSIFFSIMLVFTLEGPRTKTYGSEEKRLSKLIQKSNHRAGIAGRPVFNTNETLHVQVGIALVELLELYEHHQILVLSVWQRLMWKDIFLRWNPKEFGDVDVIRLPSDAIWTPDIVLYNSVQEERAYKDDTAKAVVYYDGSVLWIRKQILKTKCALDMQYFPFDTQSCTLDFGSWTYDGLKLDVDFYDDVKGMDLSDYYSSSEWYLVDHTAMKHIKYYTCCIEPYPYLVFNVTFMRRPEFYLYTFLLPLGLVNVLPLAIYWLPPGSGAKCTLGGIVFFSNLVLLLNLGIMYKATRLVKMGVFGMILTTIAMMLSILTANLVRMGQYGSDVPSFLNKVFVEKLGYICCIKRPKQKYPAGGKWEILATVFDRLFFAIHLLLVIITFAIFFH